MKRKWYCCQIFLFRITDFVLMLHSLMFEGTYNVVLLALVFLFAWNGKCCCNTDVRHTFLLAWWGDGGGGGMYIKYFHLKIPSLYSLLTSCVAESVKICVRKKKKNYMMTNISYYNKWLPPCVRSVARIIFWWHDHMPRAHNIHVMYNFELHSSQVAAEWGVCVVKADVRHTVKNIYFSTSVQKLLTLLLSPFTQTWLTIWPSKKYKSHTDIYLKKFNPFCPLSSHTFWHLVIIYMWPSPMKPVIMYMWPSPMKPGLSCSTAAASQPSAVCSLDSCKSAQCSQPSVYSLDSFKSAQCCMQFGQLQVSPVQSAQCAQFGQLQVSPLQSAQCVQFGQLQVSPVQSSVQYGQLQVSPLQSAQRLQFWQL